MSGSIKQVYEVRMQLYRSRIMTAKLWQAHTEPPSYRTGDETLGPSAFTVGVAGVEYSASMVSIYEGVYFISCITLYN